LERWDKVYYAFSEQLKFQPGIDLFAFSDTLIISAAGSRAYLENRLGFIELLSGLIIPSFTRSILYKIFLRGVMSMGRYYRSSRILIGPAVDDAAACYEKSNWIGISLTPETSKVLDNNQNVNSDILVNYPVPYKNFIANSWAINWTKYASEQSLYIECKSILSEEFQKHKGEQNIQNKYANTLRFCEYLVQ
jgi:hypothetical protein